MTAGPRDQSARRRAVRSRTRSRRPTAPPGDVTIQVSKEESSLRATRADGTLVFYAPVSSGSIHDPLPPGDWQGHSASAGVRCSTTTRICSGTRRPRTRKPQFRPARTTRSAWSGSRSASEHYGMHGTPEPGNIGHTESHGCVRLTNWDAARVASLVKPGTRSASSSERRRSGIAASAVGCALLTCSAPARWPTACCG